ADEGQGEHAAEVLCGLIEAREDAAAFLQPADQPFNDVAAAICLLVELNGPSRAIFVLLGWDHRLDSQVEQVCVDPVSSISFVAAQGERPSDSLSVFVEQTFIGRYEQLVDHGRFVRLASREVEVQGETISIAEDVDFCRKTPARTA